MGIGNSDGRAERVEGVLSVADCVPSWISIPSIVFIFWSRE